MKFEVTILGCGSATPTVRHSPTSQLVNHEEQFFLFDCGEGTQLQLRKYRISIQRINHIFITHLHGDHYLGLPGLISTMHLLGRTADLHIYSHSDLQEATEIQLRISHSRLRFEVIWHPLNYKGENLVFENKKIKITSFPLSHRVLTCGYKVEEKLKPRNIIPECIEKYNIPVPRIRQIKKGADYELGDGTIIPNKDLTLDPPEPKSFAFCTDTEYKKSTAKYVKGVDVLYHESTFLEAEKSRARETFHSTAKDAARVAKEAEAKKLVMGHYSARYKKTTDFLSEALDVFPETILGEEGLVIPI